MARAESPWCEWHFVQLVANAWAARSGEDSPVRPLHGVRDRVPAVESSPVPAALTTDG